LTFSRIGSSASWYSTYNCGTGARDATGE
jgi:hypothetical protein